MFNDNELDEKIINYFSMLHGRISYNTNILGYTDDNRKAEILFKEIYNIIYNSKFEHCDSEQLNNKAIDLIDVSNKDGIAVQITSTHKKDKINKTIKSFKEEYGKSNIKILEILVIGIRKDLEKSEKIQFQKDTGCKIVVKDINRLIKEIIGLDNEKKRKILEYLDGNLVELLKDDFDTRNQTEIKFGRMGKFKNYLIKNSFKESEWKEYKSNLKRFLDNIQSISKEVRNFICVILNNNLSFAADTGIKYNPNEICRKMKINLNTQYDYIRTIEQYKFKADLESEIEDNIVTIWYPMGEDNLDVLSDLFGFCDEMGIPISDVILDLNTGSLD